MNAVHPPLPRIIRSDEIKFIRSGMPIKNPKKPMKDNEVQAFTISKTDKPACKLIPSFTTTTIRVLKREKELDNIYTYFYVVPSGTHYIERSNKELHTWRYEAQIAYAQCQPGWVAKVWVNDGKALFQMFEAAPINARRCGIATLLTRLCLIDPAINKPIQRTSKALQNLENHADVFDDVIEHCTSAFVGLQMSAEPKNAAHGYLSAAIKENYKFMIVQEDSSCGRHDWQIDDIFGVSPSSFYYYEIAIAQEKYNGQNGRIGECECNVFGRNRQNDDCNAFDGCWYFCK